ncbi:MAG: hypothetical protein AAFO29_11905 [Actinomycetota bacterium]
MAGNSPTPGQTGLPEPWQRRVGSARASILGDRPSPMIINQIDAVERSLGEAAQDRARLARATADLDPQRVTAELKAALRSPGADEALVASLRRRHETVNDLLNRRERLDQRIEATVTDLETLALRTAAQGLRGDDGKQARRELDQLSLDVELLAQAHRELDHL